MIFVPKYASPTFPPIHQQQQQGPGGSSYIIFLRPSTGPGAALAVAVALVHCNACAQKYFPPKVWDECRQHYSTQFHTPQQRKTVPQMLCQHIYDRSIKQAKGKQRMGRKARGAKLHVQQSPSSDSVNIHMIFENS